jgi:hypothetical protein
MEVHTASKDVLEADVEGSVVVGGKDRSGLANNISRASVLVAVRVANLSHPSQYSCHALTSCFKPSNIREC